jgi:hypothetical protein
MIMSQSSARLAHGCLARSDNSPKKFPHSGFINLGQMNVWVEVSFFHGG